MENKSICKLALFIVFSLQALAAPSIPPSSTTPDNVTTTVIEAAIPPEHGLDLRTPADSTTILVTAAYICILVDGNPICANSNFHPSSYVVQGDGTSDRISATIYADFPNDPSATMATPGCGLIVSWPDSIRSVYWMNDTALTYTDGDQTFFQNCFEESDGLMDNPYFIPPESVAASSTTAPPPAPTRATQSCHGVDHQFWCAYDILIRVPYIGSADCDLTYHALEDYKKANAELTNWHCEEQDGFIHLYFNANVNVAKLNSALEQRYPSVDSFNCGACST